MSLRGSVKDILEHWHRHGNRREHDLALMDIYDGDLKGQIIEYLKKDMPNTWDRLVGRLAPINVLKRLVDKLSKIYQQSVVRSPVNASDTAVDLLGWYETSMEANVYWNIANEQFNLVKSCLVQPFVHQGKPRMRVISPDKFLVRSSDPIDSTTPTEVTLHMGKYKGRDYFHTWTDQEFLVFDDKGEILKEEMDRLEMDGSNPLGRIPYVYCKRSRRHLIPKADSDLLQMSLLIPILLSDLNYAIKWQAYAIIIFLNARASNLVRDPSIIWEIHSDPENPDSKPEIQTVKPDVDIDKVLQLASEELGLWLQTQGIKPGAVGRLSGDNYSSGISKMIDEMDTHENRQVQVAYFRAYEHEFWDLTLNTMHRFWKDRNLVEASEWEGERVITDFPKQLPMESRSAVLDEIKKALDLKLMTRVDAVKRLNAGWTDEQAKAYLEKIDKEYQQNDVDKQDSQDE